MAAPTRKPKSRNAAATRAAYIAAAEKLFAEHGFKGATLDMLGEAAQANKALVAYHFGSKEGLYDAVIEALVADVIAKISARLEDKTDPADAMRAYIRELAAAFAERPSFPAILLREYLDGDMQAREAAFRSIIQFYRMTENLYQQGAAAGVFREVDPHKLHLSIVAPLVHFSITARFREQTLPRFADDIVDPAFGDFAEALADLILNGMRV